MKHQVIIEQRECRVKNDGGLRTSQSIHTRGSSVTPRRGSGALLVSEAIADTKRGFMQ